MSATAHPTSPWSRAVLVAMFLALAGCQGACPTTGELPNRPTECDENGHGCLPDEQCVEGRCVPFEKCETDEECPSAAYHCTFPAQLCELRPGFGLECIDGPDCEPGEFCALGRCRSVEDARVCARRTDCPLGQACDRLHYFCIEEGPCTIAEDYPELECDPEETCDETSGLCQLECQNECTVATEIDDCGVGQKCDGACRCVQCITSLDCGPGLVCNARAGRCESENLCYSDEECEEPLVCDPHTALCQVPSPPCEDDLDCAIAEVCNRNTGVCELPGGACYDDRYEDADTPATAEIFAPTLDGVPLYIDELVLCPDDDDVYAVALAPGDELVAAISNTAALARATLWLLDEAGETSLGFAEAQPYGNGTIVHVAQETETVFLRVNALLGQSPYDLELTMNPGTPCEADAYEGPGNDTYTNPTPEGAFPLATAFDATLCPNDHDFFAVTLDDGEGVEVVIDFDPTFIDFDVTVKDGATGELIGQSAGILTPEDLRVRVPNAKPVVVEVKPFGNSTGPYTATITRLPAIECVADAFEDDSAGITLAEDETVLDVERSLCVEDQDVYVVPLLDFERVVARATFEPQDLDVVIDVLDATGTTVLVSSPNASGGETVTYDATTDETVLVRYTSQFNTQASYTATVFRENQLDCSPDALEPNDTVATAVPAPDTPISLTLCGSDRDYFVVEGTEGKRLVATAAFIHADGDIDLMILGTDGTQILASSDGVGNEEHVEAVLPVDGAFTVRVFSLSNDPKARYDVTIALENE